jgi:hypothetical protein
MKDLAALNETKLQCSPGMDRFGSTENAAVDPKLFKGLVGAWGFEPQTPYRVNSALPLVNSFQINKH